MLKSFKDKDTEKIFNRQMVRGMHPELQQTAFEKLVVLSAATSLDDLGMFPGNRLEALKGDRKGQHSIRVNRQFRICFRWDGGNAFEVEITDYH